MNKMKIQASLVLLSLFVFTQSCSQNSMNNTHTNHLINESSPYLLLHAHNPVDWYPWGNKALSKAKEKNKLIIVSIGYTACHWCHVMEEESFADYSVAALMNKHYVSIKVDREERPDIDKVYMDACYLINQSGGWPLNAIALPDGRPVYAGTYFPKKNWMDLLDQIQEIWEKEPDKLIEQAESIAQGLNNMHTIQPLGKNSGISEKDVHNAFKSIYRDIDFEYGGHQRAPKFPMPTEWNFLLNYSEIHKDEDAKEALVLTLDKIGMGGIYDHLGGGFARYSVDKYWKVPHFEKMLYDNAQLISLYSKAFRITQNESYKQIVEESIAFVERELLSPHGGFYSSLDADSEGEEGTYYVWTASEIESILGKNANLFKEFYNVTNKGNWEEGKNVLYNEQSFENFAKKHSANFELLEGTFQRDKERLFKIRDKRIHPAVDDKILCSWNALMLSAYADAFLALKKDEYYQKAIRTAEFIKENFIKKNYRLDRNYKNKKSSINAYLDDYAFTIKAFLDLYQIDFLTRHLEIAKGLMAYSNKHFFDEKRGYYYYTSDEDPKLVSRTYETSDNVIPASCSQMAHNLFVLGEILDDSEYKIRAEKMLLLQVDNISKHGAYYSNWADLLLKISKTPFEIVIVGKNYKDKVKELQNYYLPNVIIVASEKEIKELPLTISRYVEGKTMIYVCQNKVCQLPVEDVREALNQILK